ncbi:MAG: glycosyltransferase [Bacteroidetes bacterium]|nr:MAG: glycosyltransferase [Bacteroidota bacterium]
MNKVVDISVVVPLLNEEKNLPELLERLNIVLGSISSSYEIILVNDGSSDGSLAIIEKEANRNGHLKYISLSRNFGHQIAIFAGLEKTCGKLVVLIDGDLQDPPETIRDLHTKIIEGYNVVYARRASRKGEGVMKKATAKLFYRILNRITYVHIPVDVGDFRIMDRKVVNEVLKMKEPNKFLRGQIAWLGLKESYLEFERDKRKGGSTHFSYRKMFHFAIDGITGFSTFPLKFASILGIFVSLFAFLFIIYILIDKLVLHHTISGWSSIMVTILFLGGVQLLSIGIIGEYMSRINDSVRSRQLYVIEKTNIEESEPDN